MSALDATNAVGKPKFRARKLEPTKPIKVYQYHEIEGEEADELLGPATSTRTSIIIATGVDKEEEDEEHLQAALTTAMVAPKDQQYVIPTPEVQPLVADYELLYPSTFKLPKAMYLKAPVNIRMGELLDNQLPSPRERPSKYNADRQDTEFLATQKIDIDMFEVLMEWCDMIANSMSESMVTVEECFRCLPWLSSDVQLGRIIEYWNSKRPKLPKLRHEDMGKIGSDPYVCFRRREFKQPRKTRRSDAQCVDRIKKLRYELECISTAMSMAIKRDLWRLEAMNIERDIFFDYLKIMELQERGEQLPESLSQLQPFRQVIALPLPAIRPPTQSGPKKGRSVKRTSAGTDDQASRYKISLPITAFKSLKYSRPYYPVEMLKLLQQDMDGLQASIGKSEEDVLPDLWKENFVDDSDALFYRRAPVDLPCLVTDTPGAIRARRGRSNRLLLDYEPDHQQVLKHCGESLSMLGNRHDLSTRLSLLTLKECAQLNNQTIGNYNHHYIQSTVHLTKPYTFFSWLTATSGLQSISKPRSGHASRTSSPNKRPRSESPQLRVPSSLSAQANIPSSSSGSSTQQRPSRHPSPNALGNIIVKVKKSSSNESNGGGGGGHGGPNTPPNSQPLVNQAKRFTPNGLSPGE